MIDSRYHDLNGFVLRFDYDLGPDSFVLDLGGYEGQWASDIYSRYRCRIVVFEPVSAYADSIRKRFRLNDNIETFEFGLGASTRTETIYIRGAGSSTFGRKADAEPIADFQALGEMIAGLSAGFMKGQKGGAGQLELTAGLQRNRLWHTAR